MGSPYFTIEKILSILPHRYPFLLVDRVDEFQEGPNPPSRAGRRLRATKNVSFNEPFFQGHFPHRPVMPGVLIVEAMAQAAALACFRVEEVPQDVAIAGIRSAKFRIPVSPGQVLDLRAHIVKDRGQMLLTECQAFVDGKLAAETELLAKVFPKEEIKR